MNKLIVCGILVAVFSISGCLIRTIPYEVERVDQEIKGNRGVIHGKVSPKSTSQIKKTRKMYNIEIELFSPSDVVRLVKEKQKDVDLRGNRGYLVDTELAAQKTKEDVEEKKMDKRSIGSGISREARFDYPGALHESQKDTKALEVKKEFTKLYTVQKGDTLQKVSDKMYGTTRKWKRIYEANRNILESPDKISPGQELVIPWD